MPAGWTIERVRTLAHGDAELVTTDPGAIVDAFDTSDDGERVRGTAALSPTCILKFVDLYLVQDGDGCWYMGQATDDGVIHCWASY